MGKALVIYDTATSSIKGVNWVSQDKDADHYPLDPSTETALEVPADHPVMQSQQPWKIANGQLVQKNLVTLSASAATFPADGTSTVDLTFTGLSAAASVQVGNQAVTISPADNVITLSSDTPQSFTVQLVDADQWSNPVTVEAQ